MCRVQLRDYPHPKTVSRRHRVRPPPRGSALVAIGSRCWWVFVGPRRLVLVPEQAEHAHDSEVVVVAAAVAAVAVATVVVAAAEERAGRGAMEVAAGAAAWMCF